MGQMHSLSKEFRAVRDGSFHLSMGVARGCVYAASLSAGFAGTPCIETESSARY